MIVSADGHDRVDYRKNGNSQATLQVKVQAISSVVKQYIENHLKESSRKLNQTDRHTY